MKRNFVTYCHFLMFSGKKCIGGDWSCLVGMRQTGVASLLSLNEESHKSMPGSRPNFSNKEIAFYINNPVSHLALLTLFYSAGRNLVKAILCAYLSDVYCKTFTGIRTNNRPRRSKLIFSRIEE